MKIDNKNIVIGVLLLALGGLSYFYIKKNKNITDNSEGQTGTGSGTGTSGSTDITKADKEKEAEEKAKKEKDEENAKQIEANNMAKKVKALTLQISMLGLNINNGLFGNFATNSNRNLIQDYQNEKMNLLNEIGNLGYKWSYPNDFATKR